MRRGLSLVFALLLAAAAQVPVLACVLPAAAECHLPAPAAAQPQHCDSELPAVPAPGQPADDPGDSCCVLTASPIPEAPGKTEVAAPAVTLERVPSASFTLIAAEPRGAEPAAPIVSPDRQPVLCTFLI
jgi:hypothetical protein